MTDPGSTAAAGVTPVNDGWAPVSDGERLAACGSYPMDRLFEEVAFVAYHFNWSHDDVLNMPHWERRRWCEEISKINERMNERTER